MDRRVVLLALAVLAACQPTGPDGPARPSVESLLEDRTPKDTRPCILNFSQREGTFIERRFASWLESPTVKREVAFARARHVLHARGWYELEVDEPAGSIQVSPTAKKPPVATLEVKTEGKAAGSRMDVSYVLHGNSNSTRVFAEAEICLVLEEAMGLGSGIILRGTGAPPAY